VFDLGDRMHIGEQYTSLLVVALAVGIGVGSLRRLFVGRQD